MALVIKVEFVLTGTRLSPDGIIHLLGITPVRTWQKGDSIQDTKLRRKHNGWCLSIKGNENSIDLADYITPLLEVLLPKSELITDICREYELDAEFSCVIYIKDEAPIINFSTTNVINLAKLHAAIDVDIILTEMQT